MNEKEMFGSEVGKIIPVEKIYDDVMHPALSELGNKMQGLVRVALAPISALVWGYEKIAAYLDVEIPKYFEKKRISKEKIQTPPVNIAVPAIEAMRYANKEILKQMYVDLLGASMNIDTTEYVHPSFVEIIKQLTPDEAKILKRLPKKGLCEPLVNIEIAKSDIDGRFVLHNNCGVLGYEAGCEFPDNISLYIDNLIRLSLVNIPETSYLVDEWRYKKIVTSEYYQTLIMEAEQFGEVHCVKRMIGLTNYGMQFRDVCLS